MAKTMKEQLEHVLHETIKYVKTDNADLQKVADYLEDLAVWIEENEVHAEDSSNPTPPPPPPPGHG